VEGEKQCGLRSDGREKKRAEKEGGVREREFITLQGRVARGGKRRRKRDEGRRRTEVEFLNGIFSR
jgi:hypothetical protein